jgi:hypothetical protein
LGGDAQPKSIDLPLQESGVIAMAVSSARAATTKDGETYGPGFEDLPEDRMGMAIPVLVGGRVVAVVYADGVTSDANGHAVPSSWPEVIEVLARHAGRCLEALTAQKAAAPSSVGTAGQWHALGRAQRRYHRSGRMNRGPVRRRGRPAGDPRSARRCRRNKNERRPRGRRTQPRPPAAHSPPTGAC